MKKRNIFILALFLAGLISFHFLSPAFAAINTDLKPYIESVDQVQKGMTLWQLIKCGGFIMVILAALSILAIAIIIYDFMTLKVQKLAPSNFTEDIIQKLDKKQHKIVEELCKANENMISNIVLAGLSKKSKGALFMKEAIENRARKEITDLWQNLTYLSDIAVIAPLLGLLGTILGMIQAFNVIVVQTAVVKPIMLAGGVSKAMVTTAGGLIVAIPALIFYAYFRGKVQEVSNVIESHCSDIIKIMEGV